MIYRTWNDMRRWTSKCFLWTLISHRRGKSLLLSLWLLPNLGLNLFWILSLNLWFHCFCTALMLSCLSFIALSSQIWCLAHSPGLTLCLALTWFSFYLVWNLKCVYTLRVVHSLHIQLLSVNSGLQNPILEFNLRSRIYLASFHCPIFCCVSFM